MEKKDLEIGSVIFWKDYKFDNGDEHDKLLVVLGCKNEGDFLMALTTSQPHRRIKDPGCHQRPYTYYFIEGSKRDDFFKKPTWILLHSTDIYKAGELLQACFNGLLRVEGKLNVSKIGAIRNCYKYSDDASAEKLSYL